MKNDEIVGGLKITKTFPHHAVIKIVFPTKRSSRLTYFSFLRWGFFSIFSLFNFSIFKGRFWDAIRLHYMWEFAVLFFSTLLLSSRFVHVGKWFMVFASNDSHKWNACEKKEATDDGKEEKAAATAVKEII